MTYFNSADIRVFPSAYRGFKPTESTEALDAAPQVWNADATVTTEYNLTHMFSHLLGQQSFIISSPEKTIDENADFKCVINGYYFEIDGAAFQEAYAEGTSASWLNTLRGERKGCLCIRVFPKFETNGSGSGPETADFNLTSLITMDPTQTSEGYLLDNEEGKFTGLAFYPNASSFPSSANTLADGSVVYRLLLNDESLYAETVYQEIKEKIIDGVKAVNWSKHLEVAPLSVGTDRTIDLNSYAGIGNLHTFYVGDLKTLCVDGALTEMVNFPAALGTPAIFKEADSPNLFIALEVFDPGIGSESSPKTSPVIQILHTFGYSEAKVAVEHTCQTDIIKNTYESLIDKDSDYYTKEFDSDCCTFIRYGHRDSSLSGAVITWDSWEGLSDEELKLFACVRAMEAEQRLTDALILGDTIPRFAERLKIYKNTEGAIPTNLKPGWYYYTQSGISALDFLGGETKLDPTISWEQKQLLNETYYTALLEVIGDDEAGAIPCLQRLSIVNSSNEVIASGSRAVRRSSGASEKWAFDITSANIQDQFVAFAEKQKVHQIHGYTDLKKLIKDLYKISSRDDKTPRGSLQVELQFTNDLTVPSYSSGKAFHIFSGTIGHLTTSWSQWHSTGWVFQLFLELQKFDFKDTDKSPPYDETGDERYSSNGISSYQTLTAELKLLAGQNFESVLESLQWVVRYPTNVQNPIPLNSYADLASLQVRLMLEMPFGEDVVSDENNQSVPVIITGTEFIIKGASAASAADYAIPRGSIGYLAILADQTILENPDSYGSDLNFPFVFVLSLLTPADRRWDNSWDKSCFIARQYYGRDRAETWQVSGGYVDRAAVAEVAESIVGGGVQGKVSYARQADEALKVRGEKVVGVVNSAKKAAEATKAFSLSLNSARAEYDEDTDTGIGDSLSGSSVTANVSEPGLYLVEVVLRHLIGPTAVRDSTLFFIPEYSDKPAPQTQQILCNGAVVLATNYSYSSRSLGDYRFNGATFNAQAPHGLTGSLVSDLAIKVWQMAETPGKANGPFQNK